MRRTAISFVMSVLILTAASASAQQAQDVASTATAASDTHNKFLLDGEAALWTVAIRPDKTADFERVIEKLRQALTTSDVPGKRQQAQGWTVLRLATPLPDGNVAYVHDVRPVVRGADYSIMQILYDAFPDERQALYELYRGAFVKNVALAAGNVVGDTSETPSGSSTVPPATSGSAPQ